MKTPAHPQALITVALLLLAAAPMAGAQSIYRCTHAGQVEYTDRPCPGNKGELIHQADDSEIIDQYLRLGQQAKAESYAESHHLQGLYQQRLAAHQRQLEENARRRADEAYAAQQREEQARVQALAEQAAQQSRLQAENDALRQQNDQYRQQLTEPNYTAPPVYWVAPPPHWNGDHGGHGNHRPPPAKPPVFHPCKQLAGGRVEC